ncbi:MAG: hypothetical protein EOM50_09395 [Erysipelotrichia bacterium]|nr:hypothetical protein [Erysipelotrichia bacterium]
MNKNVLIGILIVFPLLMLCAFLYTLHLKNQLPTDIANHERISLEFKNNTVQCPQCHMYLVGKKYTAQIITNDLKTHFFDDIGCAILWLKEHKIEPKMITFWVFSNDTDRYINAFKASYSLTDNTPMHYGFGAYQNWEEGRINFEEMRLRMLRGENMSDPKIRKQLLGS